MLRRSLALLLLISAVSTSLAVTPGELSAVQTVLANIPGLATQVSPPWSPTADPCATPQFYGVKCSNEPDPHILSLIIDRTGLEGSFDGDYSGLQWIQTISLTKGCYEYVLDESLTKLPLLTTFVVENDLALCKNLRPTHLEDYIGSFPSLTYLSFSLVELSGSLPSAIGTLSSLQTLSIQYPGNSFGGAIPASIGQLTELRVLRLVGTKMTELSIDPSHPTSLPNLLIIDIQVSDTLSADISPLLDNSTKLEVLNLRSVPTRISMASLMRQSSLSHLSLRTSSLSWTLTDHFWHSFPELRVLDIQDPTVFGIVGSSIGTMKKLTTFDFDTKISGTLPEEIGNCPLNFLRIVNSKLQHPIPNIFDRLRHSLEDLHISDLFGSEGPLPSTLGDLQNLKTLTLSRGGFQGTIPASIGGLASLGVMHLDNNALHGTIPEFTATQSIAVFDVDNNRLTGTIPRSLALKASHLYVSHNRLGPSMESDLFESAACLAIRASHNHFSGSLPPNPISHMDLSHNEFSGTIPIRYNRVLYLDLSHNKLSGNLSLLVAPDHSTSDLYLHNNQLSGTIPPIPTYMARLTLSNNNFTGNLPILPRRLTMFDVANNQLSSANFKDFALSARSGGLKHLDLSGVGISGFSAYELVSSSLQILILANNGFTLENPPTATTSLLAMDITNNQISGSFSSSHLSNLVVLKAARNSLTGTVVSSNALRSITELDISDNSFTFDVAAFQSLPLLTTINARKNSLFGSLALKDLRSLQYADFSDNYLNQPPDLASIGSLMMSGALTTLNISNNTHIPPFDSLQSNVTSLYRSALSKPSTLRADSVTCYQLAFAHSSAVLDYDEDLFSYDQCDCNENHFGSPSMHCIQCPSHGAMSCGGVEANVSLNSYAFMIVPSGFHSPIASPPSESDSDFQDDSVGSLLNSLFGLTSDRPKNLDPDDFSVLKLETETCLITTVQTLTGRSNCGGIRITHEDVNRHNMSIAHLLNPQCNTGSEGRLCSKCICNANTGGECWYQSGATCSKCRRVFSLSTSLPVAASLILAAFFIACFTMKVILQKKRTWDPSSFHDLPLTKRIFYRIIYLTSLGNVSILITFVQILLGFTEWDANLKVNLFGVLNGNAEGLGLPCIFPFLSDPLWALLVQLSIPFIALVLIAASVAVGNGLTILSDARKKSRHHHDLDYDSGSGDLPLLNEKSRTIAVNYPATALLTSLSITIIKFFYFGTALAAHEYLFSTRQALTGDLYVQSKPWMKSSHAWPLVKASIPAILVFDLVIPICFLVICWKVRRHFNLPTVQIYYGSLFETYNLRCFWWEIVNTLKKLSLALVLKGFSATDAVQSALVTSILAGTLMVQVALSPWRRKIENLADTASSLLLIFAFIYTRPSTFVHAPAVVWYIFALSVTFVAVSVGVIGWQTLTGTTDYEKKYQTFAYENELLTSQSGTNAPSDWDMNSDADAATGSLN